MSTNFLRLESHCQLPERTTEHRELVNFMRGVNERRESAELLQQAIRDSERCENYRGDDVTGQNAEKCNQPGPLCLNDECGMCQSCESAGYLCPNASEHDFGGK